MRRAAIQPSLLLLSIIAVFIGCASPDRTPLGKYPEHWWEPVPQAEAASWEILPQTANPGEVILSKRHELGLLSNFAATPFEFHGKRYASMEGFWQSLLYPEGKNDPRAKTKGIAYPHSRAEVEQMIAFDAKKAGAPAKENMKMMNIDWVTFEGKRMTYWTKEKGDHYRLIREAMRAKLEQNPRVREVLLATGNLTLLPDHHVEPDAAPAWKYYEIWTELRDEIRSGHGELRP